MSPREAFFAAYEVVARDEAVGRISAELVAPYPPGVPVLVPGEEVTVETLEALELSLRAGNRIAYAADPTLESLQVVRERRHAVRHSRRRSPCGRRRGAGRPVGTQQHEREPEDHAPGERLAQDEEPEADRHGRD